MNPIAFGAVQVIRLITNKMVLQQIGDAVSVLMTFTEETKTAIIP